MTLIKIKHKQIMKKFTFIFIFLVSLVGAKAQNGTRLIGFDAQSMGRAGTSIGVFDSPELMMTNPAGLSFLDRSSLNVDFSVMAPTVHFQNSLNDAAGANNLFPLPSLSYVKKSANKDCKLTWGIGMFTQGGMGADFSLKNEMYRDQTYVLNATAGTYSPVKGAYEPQSYHSKFAVMQAGPSFAYKLTDKFSVGVSAYLVYSSLEFRMPFGMNPAIMQGTPNGMTGFTFGQMFSMSPAQGGFGYNEVIASADMSKLSTISWGGKIGFAYKASDKLSFGFNYTLPTTLNYKGGKATMDMSKQMEDAMGRGIMGLYANPSMKNVPLNTALGYVSGNFTQLGIDLTQGVAAQYGLDVKMKLPMSFGYGMSYQTTPKLKLALDAEWMNWANAFDKMQIKMSDGTSANVNKMIGGSSINMDFPLNWKNTVIVKVGAEYRACDRCTLRLGYAYGSNPVPATTLFPVFPAIVTSHVTIGGSYNVSKRVTLSVAIESALNSKETTSDPSAIQTEFSGSTSQLGTVLGHIALNWKL
jgi:long-chain fatty acid transport protein